MLSNWNIRFWEFEFYDPKWLWLLCAIPVVLFILFRLERNRKGEVKFSGTVQQQNSLGSSWILRIRAAIIVLYAGIATLLILAMAKPFHWSLHDDHDKKYKDGIDIVLTMDVSGSMLDEDFKPNRLEASKKVAKEFVDGRKGDRIGLVAYAGEAYTACPPTLDYDVLKKQIDGLSDGRVMGGTAIGLGLGTAVTRLRSDSLKSKVIILLTDGMDMGIDLDPLDAADLAKAKNIRVYTIGVGSTGYAPRWRHTAFGSYRTSSKSEVDEEVLKKIADKTDGKYFRATDEEGLKKIYEEIEKLEKRRIEESQFKSEPPATPGPFLNWAFVLILITWSTQYVLFKTNE